MKENVVKDKSFAFAIKIVKLYKYLVEEKRKFVLSKQLLCSGTAIGGLSEMQSMLKARRILFINYPFL